MKKVNYDEAPWVADARYLIKAAGGKPAFFCCLGDHEISEYKDGVLIISSTYGEEKYFHITIDGDTVDIKMHDYVHENHDDEPELVISDELDEEDLDNLQWTLEDLVGEMRVEDNIKNLDIPELWQRLVRLLLPHVDTKNPKYTFPKLDSNSIYAITHSVLNALADAKHIGECEWKWWAEVGTSSLNNDFEILKKLKISVPEPTGEEIYFVQESDMFHAEIINWFDKYLSTHEVTLLVLGFFEESQQFTVVEISKIQEIIEILKLFGVAYSAADKYCE